MSVHPSTTSGDIFTTRVDGGPHKLAFLHGLFGQGRNFTGIAKALAPEATSLLIDLPDHGKSAHTSGIDLDAYADRIVPVLQNFAPGGDLVLVGHSLGGKVAMRIALRYPDLIERLVVVDIAPVAGGVSTFPQLAASLLGLDLASLKTRGDADAALKPEIEDDRVRGFLLQNLRISHGTWGWLPNLEGLAASLDGVAGWPEIDAQFRKPVLWVAGQRSDYITPEVAPAMRALFPLARLVTIKDAGHWVHSEQPDAFTKTVRQFLLS